jgi:DedD protein
MGRDNELYRDKIEVSLDGRQIFSLFFAGAVIVCTVFVIGVIIGKRVEARAHVDRGSSAAAGDPLAVLDRLESGAPLSFRSSLRGGQAAGGSVDAEIASMANAQRAAQRTAGPDGPDGRAGASTPLVGDEDGAGGDARVASEKAKSKASASKSGPNRKGESSSADSSAKPEVKTDAKTDAKSEVKSDATPDAKTEAKPEVKLAVKPEAKTEAKPEVKLAVKPEAKTEAKPEVKLAVKPEAKADAKTDAKADAKAKKARYTLQLSSFQERGEAETFLAELRAAGYSPFLVAAEVDGKGTFYRVRLGSYPAYDDAVKAKADVEHKVNRIAYVTKL